MSTHNICFRGEIRKLLYGYPGLSGAMVPDKRGIHYPDKYFTYMLMKMCCGYSLEDLGNFLMMCCSSH